MSYTQHCLPSHALFLLGSVVVRDHTHYAENSHQDHHHAGPAHHQIPPYTST